MTTFTATTVRDLNRFLEILNAGPTAAEKFEELTLTVYGPKAWQRWAPRVREILTHSSSKVCKIRLEERVVNALGVTGAISLVAMWCEEVHLEATRKLEFHYCGNSNVHGLDALANALTSPNAQVAHIAVEGGSEATPLASSILRSWLEHPRNNLASLSILYKRAITQEEAADLAVGFASENCIITRFRMDFNGAISPANHTILDGLYRVSSLHELEWSGSAVVLNEEGFMTRLGHLLKKPGNELRILRAIWVCWRVGLVESLAKSLTHANCRVETFESGNREFFKRTAAPLLLSLRHSNSSLRTLFIHCSSEVSNDLEESLKHVNCKLVSLRIMEGGGKKGELSIAVAKAMLAAPDSRLRRYHGSLAQSSDELIAFTQSLRSYRNRLTELRLDTSYLVRSETYRVTMNQFFRALRLSNVVRYHNQSRAEEEFVRAFNEPFLQVFYALMSLDHVPRLGSRALVRVLPLHQLIIAVAETLGWPLDSLRTSTTA